MVNRISTCELLFAGTSQLHQFGRVHLGLGELGGTQQRRTRVQRLKMDTVIQSIDAHTAARHTVPTV